ncbi:hypothetical protein ACFVS2_20360 [Brevibacillus sp. NPDC058079]|uniref:hypothetical protein n=1 Tax=Brevibacillus sp. NPDC058079 TaxID=3346330 RepID=UPI0036E675CA
MTQGVIRNHQCTIFHMKEEQLDDFTKELHKEAKQLKLQVKSFEYRRNQVFFTLQGEMHEINRFLGDFAAMWSIQEMGVSEFARIMEVSDLEAQEWYEEVAEYKGIIMNKASFESKIVAKFGRMTDLAKLEYLKRHFMDNLEELIQTRIDTVEGKEDEFSLYLKRQAEKQDLLIMLENIDGHLDPSTIEKLKTFIQNS